MANQTERVLVQLRDLILKGKFVPGARLAEIPIAQQLNASRTPVRLALIELEKEGLVEAIPSGGYVMRQFGRREADDAIAVRAHLEGLAARLIAEQGMSRALEGAFRDCLLAGDRVLQGSTLDVDGYAGYIAMNDKFHRLLIEGAGNAALARAIEFTSRLPLAAPSAMLPMQASTGEGRTALLFTHRQHHDLVDAMARGQGVRAQALAEEHANTAKQNLQRALDQPEALRNAVPALRLMRERS
jgi:GntR family transcriptional regulator, vanillate catabolism transcriptional regulator